MDNNQSCCRSTISTIIDKIEAMKKKDNCRVQFDYALNEVLFMLRHGKNEILNVPQQTEKD